MRRTRRALLAAVAPTLATLAGCAAVQSREDENPIADRSPTGRQTTTETDMQTGTNAPTATTTDAVPPNPDALSFSATVVQQASADAPARIAVSLANDGDSPIPVGADPALFASYVGTFPELALVARDADGVAASRTDGCWRVTVDVDQGPVERAAREVPAGGSITERYGVYTRERSAECLSDGTYAVTSDLPVVGVDATVSLTLQFRIEDRRVGVDRGGTGASV